MESEEKKVMWKWLKLGMRTLDFTKTGHEWKKSQDESSNTGEKQRMKLWVGPKLPLERDKANMWDMF
jgi:hypothetical protein